MCSSTTLQPLTDGFCEICEIIHSRWQCTISSLKTLPLTPERSGRWISPNYRSQQRHDTAAPRIAPRNAAQRIRDAGGAKPENTLSLGQKDSGGETVFWSSTPTTLSSSAPPLPKTIRGFNAPRLPYLRERRGAQPP